jgi:hypothetical protein
MAGADVKDAQSQMLHTQASPTTEHLPAVRAGQPTDGDVEVIENMMARDGV